MCEITEAQQKEGMQEIRNVCIFVVLAVHQMWRNSRMKNGYSQGHMPRI